MRQNDYTIRWRNKPLDTLSADEMRTALVESLGHAMRPQRDANPNASFYSTFLGGMVAGGMFCLGALVILHAMAG